MDGVRLLQEAYTQSFGIFDYVRQAVLDQTAVSPDQRRPLAQVALHPAEDYAGTSEMRAIVKRYADFKVKERYLLSLYDFLELPHEYAEYILEDCEEVIRQQLAVVDNLPKLDIKTKK